jgi:hypothetical protein
MRVRKLAWVAAGVALIALALTVPSARACGRWVIVFDAGTNDNPAYPQILAENLTAVAERIGDRCKVVPTVHGLTVNGIGDDGRNRVVEAFATSLGQAVAMRVAGSQPLLAAALAMVSADA